MPENDKSGAAYWKANLRLMTMLMSVWAIVSFGFGILLRDVLDAAVSFGGVGLGFWFAQNGSMYVFLLLIVIYAHKMGQLDREFDVDE